MTTDMLFNCFQCGKTISSKSSVCAYCKADTTQFALDFNKEHQKGTVKEDLKVKYHGTLLSFLLKAKPTR